MPNNAYQCSNVPAIKWKGKNIFHSYLLYTLQKLWKQKKQVKLKRNVHTLLNNGGVNRVDQHLANYTLL